MKAPFRRLPLAIALTGIMVFALAGVATAFVTSKTIDTTTGECTKDANGNGILVGGGACGDAVYGADGFTGHITFDASEAGHTVSLVDIFCVHTAGGVGSFNSLGVDGSGNVTGDPGSSADYTLTITDTSGSATGSYNIVSGKDCSDTLYNPFVDVSGLSWTISDLTVSYSLLIDGITADNAASAFGDSFNSVLNKIYEKDGTQVTQQNSASVGAPSGPPPVVPEAPLTVLLLGTGGLTSVWYVSRKLRQRASLTAA
jgi:hypothetical protein